jgi:hypothetical protein
MYETNLGSAAVQSLGTGQGQVFCGQRSDPFFVDLGSIFDLADLRPFQALNVFSPGIAAANGGVGVDGTKALNIHTIAIQVPISRLTSNGTVPTTVSNPAAVLGIWSGASRRKVRMIDDHTNQVVGSGPWVQVSRLGNPLFNEVIVPMSKKDEWNGDNPVGDVEYLPNVLHPELAGLIAAIYAPNFTHLAGLSAPRQDLAAILLTGIPGVNFTGTTPADMLRLNVAIPTSGAPVVLGIDLGGFPNGRRLADDIVAIELRAIAGLTYPLVDATYTPDGAAGLLTQGIPVPETGMGDRYLPSFPYVGSPYDGYDTPSV